MNKHDIEELQQILSGDNVFLNESSDSRRMFHNIKQDNSKMLSIKEKHSISDKKKHARSKLKDDRSLGRIYFEMSRSDCKNELDIELFNKLHTLISKVPKSYFNQTGMSDDKIDTTDEIFNISKEICKLFYIDPSKYGVNFGTNTDDFIEFNFIKYSTNENLIPIKDISSYIFIHFDRKKGLTHINPGNGSSHFHGTYAKKTIFFFALKRTGDITQTINQFRMSFSDQDKQIYGENAYQYFPKRTDKFFRDVTDRRNIGTLQLKNHFGFLPVLLETNEPVEVTNITNAFESHLKNVDQNKIRSYGKDLTDKQGNLTQVDVMLGIYSDKCFDDIKNEMKKWVNSTATKNNTKSGPKNQLISNVKQIVSRLNANIDRTIASHINDPNEIKLLKNEVYSNLRERIKNEFGHTYAEAKSITNLIVSYVHESYIDETIDRFDAFMEEFNNGQIGDNEFIIESALSRKYAKITKEWMTRNKLQWFYYDRNEKFDDPLPDEVVDYLFNLVWKLKRCDKNCNFKAYKTIYDEFCEITHYPNNTCIMGNMINSNHKIDMGSGSMHLQRLKPAYLKTGIHLFHASDDPNLTVLTPDHFVGMNQYIHLPNGKNAFIGKDTYYAFPRAYFYIETSGTRYGFNKASRFQYDSNNMPIINDTNKQDGHLYMYITKFGDRIYIDNELASKTKYATIGTPVFMLVSKPIKLIKIY